MTEHKYTDEEVIKALECCCSTSVVNCNKCTYAKPAIDDYCANILMRDALDLINRQKAETAALTSAVDNSTKEFLKLHDAYQDQKAEIERLKNGWRADVILTEQAKAEAIKEFHHKLYDECLRLFTNDDETILIVDKADYLVLVKKMTGGDENG